MVTGEREPVVPAAAHESARHGLARLSALATIHDIAMRYRAPLLTTGFLIVGALGVAWWVSLISEFAGPITQSGHHDFFAFYSAGTLIREGQPQSLYDASTLTALERHIWPHATGYAGYMPFLNPPSAAVILSPLASLPFATARLLWLAISIALAIACAVVLTSGRDLRTRGLAVVAVLATFPAYQTFTEGQWSFVILLGALGALVMARRHLDWLAGALLLSLWLKPPLFLLVLVWLLITRHWRIAAGAVGAVIVLTLVTLPWTGFGADVNYIQYLGGVTAAHATGSGAVGSTTWEGALPNMEGLIGLAATFAGQAHPLAVDVLTGVMAAGLLAYFVWATRSRWLARPLPPQVALSWAAARSAPLRAGLRPHRGARCGDALSHTHIRTLGAARRRGAHGPLRHRHLLDPGCVRHATAPTDVRAHRGRHRILVAGTHPAGVACASRRPRVASK